MSSAATAARPPLAGGATPASLRRRGSSLDTLPQLPPRDGSASSATPPVRALYKDDELLVPPGKYGLVEPGVHRSAFPSPASFRFLRLLGLRTVLNLSREKPMRTVTNFFSEAGIEVVDVGLGVWTHEDSRPISEELIKGALELLLDRARHPLLVLSSSGTHQTGTLVGCLRRSQEWSLVSILDEYRSYAAPAARVECEQFIELWDTDVVVVPKKPPRWFRAHERLLRDDAARWREVRRRQAAAEADGGEDEGGGGEMEGEEDGGEEDEEAAYFRVAGPLVSPGVHVAAVDSDDD